MAPIQHINPLLFITDTLTESDTSAPNSDTPNLTSSDSGLGQRARSHVGNSGLYQAMLSDDESSGEYDDGDEDYVVAEDDVTPPKRARTSGLSTGYRSKVNITQSRREKEVLRVIEEAGGIANIATKEFYEAHEIGRAHV